MSADLPRKFALRNAYFGMHGSGELRHGRAYGKRGCFFARFRVNPHHEIRVTLEPLGDFVALLVLILIEIRLVNGLLDSKLLDTSEQNSKPTTTSGYLESR